MSTRKPFIAGNWKMYTTLSEARELARGICELVGSEAAVDVAVLPPYPFLPAVGDVVAGTAVALGAQDLHVVLGKDGALQHTGAQTSQVSGPMLASVGCAYVTVGHSERRQFFGDTDEIVGRKVRAAFDSGLLPILCVGELLDEREAGQTLSRVSTQVRAGLAAVTPEEAQRIVIAYEPVWAIGTGRVATPEQAQEVHHAIRALLAEIYSEELAQSVRIQYGGSVKPDNVAGIMAQPDVDGALVGGASLNAESFAAIVRFREHA